MEEVTFEDCGAYALLRMNRAAKRNAVNRAMRTAFRERLEQARNRFRVVVIAGSGASFCAGIDLVEEDADRKGAFDTARQEWIDVLLAIREHPAIVLAAVNGGAFGGGISLVNVADLALASDEAQFAMPELGFAAYPGMSGPSTQLTLTRKRAAWLVLTTSRIDGVTAAAWGLVNGSVPAARLDAEVDALARQVAQFDAVTLTESKRALDAVPAT